MSIRKGYADVRKRSGRALGEVFHSTAWVALLILVELVVLGIAIAIGGGLGILLIIVCTIALLILGRGIIARFRRAIRRV